MSAVITRNGKAVQNPGIIQWLFSDPRAGLLWLPLRLYVGYQWIVAAEHKITSASWMVTGAALKGYWANAIKVADPAHPTIAYGWYRSFLTFLLNAQAYTWFAKLVSVGELLVGIGLILGAFTGIAAFFGFLMNWNYIMAGSASTNGMLLVLAVLLVIAWKVAGTVGADFFLLRWLGTPWSSREAAVQQGKAVKAKPELASTD